MKGHTIFSCILKLQYCGTRGGTLVKIEDSSQQSAAANYLNSVDSSGGGLFWTGLTDLGREGDYKWEDGTSATYFYWYSGEFNSNFLDAMDH